MKDSDWKVLPVKIKPFSSFTPYHLDLWLAIAEGAANQPAPRRPAQRPLCTSRPASTKGDSAEPPVTKQVSAEQLPAMSEARETKPTASRDLRDVWAILD